MNLLSLFLLHTAARIMHRIEGRSLTEVLFFRGINIFLAHLEVTYFVLTQGVSAFFPAKGKKGDLQLATNLINSDESSNYSRNFNMHGVSCWIAAFQSSFITSVIKSTHLLSVMDLWRQHLQSLRPGLEIFSLKLPVILFFQYQLLLVYLELLPFAHWSFSS